MPINYIFKDSKASDTVAKALLFAARFSKKQALVKFSDSSVGVIWGGSPKTYFIHAEATALDMFRNKQQLRHYGIDHCTIIQVNPTILGKTLKGGTQDRSVTICILRPNKIRVQVEYVDTAKRTIVHTLPCDFKSLDDYKSMLIEEIEQTVCRYDHRSYVENIHRLKHIVESVVKLNTQKIRIWSRISREGNDIAVKAQTQGATINISLSDLVDGFTADDGEEQVSRRQEASVQIDAKKLSVYLSGLLAQRRAKVCFEIEHNKCFKITLDNEIQQGEKFYQSILLLHSLNK